MRKNVVMKKLLKTIIAVLAVVIIVAAGLLIKSALTSDKDAPSIMAIEADASDRELIEYTKEILKAVGNRDYAALSAVAHTEYGVVFSPYATVNLGTNCCFTPSQIAAFGADTTKYIWGVYDGVGDPIEMTPAEYFDTFVFNADFTKCDDFAVDEFLRTGNSLENITEVFPGCRFVDCYMPDGENWQSLRLVFEEDEGKLMLSAVVHSENTM